MFKQLTGTEAGLFGLWSFNDGTANDGSMGAHHGRLMGQARVVEALLPSSGQLVPWARLQVQVIDVAGAPIPNVTIRAEVNGMEVGRTETGFQGLTPLTAWTAASAVDLFASGANEIGGWQLAVPIEAYAEGTNIWKMGRAVHLAGRVTALDGKTPHAALVVELIQPNEDSQRRHETPNTGTQAPNFGPGRPALAVTNHVLQLDGGSFLVLPTTVFHQLKEATVEGWVRWERLLPTAHFFSAGSAGNAHISLGPTEDSVSDLRANIFSRPVMQRGVQAPGAIRTNEWLHLAFTTGPAGMQLFVNGVLAGTNTDTRSFAVIPEGDPHVLGRGWGGSANEASFLTGQIDELRVWKAQRTAEQIRQFMFRQLSGSETELVALWNFEDAAQPGRDASSGAHHAKLIGQPKVVSQASPVLVFGNITDPTGQRLGQASVEIQQPGQPHRRIQANDAGEYSFTLSSADPCALFVTSGTWSAHRLGFQPGSDAVQRLDWTLVEVPDATVFAGQVTSVLTDGQGNFQFRDLKPGPYQLRVQVPGGRAWLDSGRIYHARPDLAETERIRMANLSFQLAPFKKGVWKKWTALEGLLQNYAGSIVSRPMESCRLLRPWGCRASTVASLSISPARKACPPAASVPEPCTWTARERSGSDLAPIRRAYGVTTRRRRPGRFASPCRDWTMSASRKSPAPPMAHCGFAAWLG